jgi:hypothetical protein
MPSPSIAQSGKSRLMGTKLVTESPVADLSTPTGAQADHMDPSRKVNTGAASLRKRRLKYRSSGLERFEVYFPKEDLPRLCRAIDRLGVGGKIPGWKKRRTKFLKEAVAPSLKEVRPAKQIDLIAPDGAGA